MSTATSFLQKSSQQTESLRPRLTFKQVAKQVGVSIPTVWRWVSPGLSDGRRLSSFKLGGRRFITPDDLDAFLASGNEPSIGDDSGSSNSSIRGEAAARELEKLGV